VQEIAQSRADDLPHSVEAEQMVIGEMLMTNCDGAGYAAAVRAGGADLFYDPVHRRVFESCQKKAAQGFLVSPVTLHDVMREDAGLRDLGGGGYLVRMAGSVVGSGRGPSYVMMLSDLKRKRDLIRVIGEAQDAIARGADDADVISARLETALINAEPVGKARPVSLATAMSDATGLIMAAYQGEDDKVLRSGLKALDSIVPGFYPGELILLGGRPSMGKSAVASCIATRAAKAGRGVCIASLEMTPESLAMRMISEATGDQGAGISYSAMRRGDMDERQARTILATVDSLADLPIHFLPPSYRDIGAIYAGVKQVNRRLSGNLGLVIVDYLGLIRGEGKSRYEEITNISIALKGLALQLGVPVLALSQLSRAVETRDEKRPQLSDLRESGQLEQDADTVLFCYRGEYYLERERPEVDDMEVYAAWMDGMDRARGKLEIIVAKQRQGEIGTAHMKFNPALNLIWEDPYANQDRRA
jgi:replicative DNA helicase